MWLVHREVPLPLLAAARLRIVLEDAVHAQPPVVREPEPPAYGVEGAHEQAEEGTELW